uniref:uncharacterized protein LOC122583349 n=1 Tax=Erigeron canadensis TaxID=72917 RepID=UPI001CB988B9|nr:uncharacterized protein LOC122583349 [Erigeron canadensis]
MSLDSGESQLPPSTAQRLQPCRIFELHEILLATENFNESFVIGKGGFGKVYKGKVTVGTSHVAVAIKRLDLISDHGATEFWAEVEMLSKLRHSHLVSLIGYCYHEREMILVYEYMPNGTLEDHLHNLRTRLSWVDRLKICIGAARGVDYLHTGTGIEFGVIHRDVKSSNILLCENWVAKISDFGLSRVGPTNQPYPYVNTIVKGTFGYLDPNYFATGKFTRKSDVYAFGVVLFEVLCRKRPLDTSLEFGLATWAQDSIKEGKLKSIVDSDIRGEISPKCLKGFARIAYRCLANYPKHRPTMTEIIYTLESLLTLSLHVQHKSIFTRRVDVFPSIFADENPGESIFTRMVEVFPFIIIGENPEYIDRGSILYEDIKSATNNYADENLVKQTTSSNIYKGRLVQTSGEVINIVVRRCTQLHIAANEIIMLKDLRHENILPIFKFCEMVDTLVIINKHEANESLDKHLSCSTLGWMQRLHICVGIARALTYLHYDAEVNHCVIHGNIKSSKILLDHDWEPKLHGFGFAVRAKRNQLYNTDKYNRSLYYMDPAYEHTRGLTHKSDVFSFGVVLFEALFGRDASSVLSTPDHNDKLYFARLARVHYEEKTLDDMIDPYLRVQMNLESLIVFSETAYFCLKEKPSERPDMKKVLQRLNSALELQRKHESLEHSTVGEATSSNHLKVKTLDHLKIQLGDIKLATNNFSEKYSIGSGGYATVYKAELDYFDSRTSPTLNKGEKRVEVPKRRGIVAIKRIFSFDIFRRGDGQAEKGFLAEIELLSKCKHPNIVSLIGFCNEETEMILVYEYATNGSLEAYLGKNDNITNLTWDKRIKISIDIAHGLRYLHEVTKDKECIIHRDIKSANILLDDKWEAKIADFGLSKLHPTYNLRSTLDTGNIGGTQVYLDPEYEKTGNLKTSSDIYSFGVVLCEILSGNVAYDNIYNTMGLPSIVRQCFNDGTIEELVDPQMKESGENTFVLDDGLNHDSLYTFSKIASQCVAEAQARRPTMEVILRELEKSLNYQNNRKDNLQISLETIKLGTQNFNDCNCTGKGRFWRLYEGEISLGIANGHTPIVAKRFDGQSDEGNSQFMTELKVLFEHKHKNIVGLVGYCNEMSEKIIVYEHASNGTLDKHLDNANLTWMKRLKIGIDVAKALEYLHTGGTTKDTPMIHRDIKSSNILLDGDWSAKLSNLEELSNARGPKKVEHIDENNAYGSLSYIDPQYEALGFLYPTSDRYSLGVVLLEMMLGKLACAEEFEGLYYKSLVRLAKTWYKNNTLDEKIFKGIKEQIVQESLDTYSAITFKCLQNYGIYRPGASELVDQLTLALAYQEDYEIWEPNFPKTMKACARFQTLNLSLVVKKYLIGSLLNVKE